MRKTVCATLLLGISTATLAFNKDFTLNNERVPYEFRQMFESMKYHIKDANEQIKMIALCRKMNTSMAPLERSESFFLLKSEITKSVLEYNFGTKSPFKPTSFTLKRLQDNLKNNDAIYTPFSKWVIQSLVADMQDFEKDGLLDMSPSQQAALTGEKRLKAQKMQRVMRYTSGWIEKADSLSATDFNELTTKVSWTALEQINNKAVLFKRHAAGAGSEQLANTFNIPHTLLDVPSHASGAQGQAPTDTKKENSGASSLAEKGAAAAAEVDAKLEELGGPTSDASTPPSEELSGAIDNIAGQGDGGGEGEPSDAKGQGGEWQPKEEPITNEEIR